MQTINETEPMTTKYKYHDPEGTYFISTTVVYWIDNDDLPGCSRAHVENTGAVRGFFQIC